MSKDVINYHEAIKLLYEVQELELTVAEAEIMHQESLRAATKIDQLKNSIADLKAEIPEEIANRYERFKPDSLPAVVDMIHGNKCSACHVSLPVGDLPRMIANKVAPICHTCGKYVYVWGD